MKEKDTHIDESLIQKYISGDMSTAERHALEKHAMTNQYLQDRLQGESEIAEQGIDKKAALEQLKSRLSKKESPKRAIWINWIKYGGIAAGIGFIMFTSYQFFVANPFSSSQEVASKVEAPLETNSKFEENTVLESPVENNNALSKANIEESKNKAQSNALPKALPETLNDTEDFELIESEAVIADADESGLSQPMKAAEVLIREEKPEPNDISEVISKPVPGIEIEKPRGKIPKIVTKATERKVGKSKIFITGRIVDEDNDGLPGAAVIEKGTKNGTSADLNGTFKLELSDSLAEAVVSFIGFESLSIGMTELDKDIVLKEDQNSLSEVVVVGYTPEYDKDVTNEEVIVSAKPKISWNEYRDLRRIESDIAGRVVLRFDISETGIVENIAVRKNLCASCDKQATKVANSISWNPKAKNGKAVRSSRRAVYKFGHFE